MQKRSRTAVVALALAAFSCTSNGGAQVDAGVPGTCSSNAECSAGFQCDRQQRRCVCTGDQACPGGFCNAFTGTCVATVPGCTADSACASSEYCDRGLRSCRPLTGLCGACKTDAQCGAGSRCAAHPSYPAAGTFCVPQCQAAGDGGAAGCANGLTCLGRDQSATPEKLCYPAQGACGVTNACAPDSRKPCSADTDCGDAAQACDQTLKYCIVKLRSCPAGDACDPQQRICVHACTVDADCIQIEGGPGYKCSANACIKQALCAADTDCSDGQICQANPDGSKSCRAGCVQNGDCPLGQSCSSADAHHPKCVQGCSASSDCPLNQICSGGACTSTVTGCAQTCQDTQVCDIASKCDAASSCCRAANLSQACPTNKTQNTQYPCTACVHATGCPSPVAACAQNCFPLSFKSCTSDNDCTAFPGSVCTPSLLCQQMVWVQPCTDDASCAYKGFKCRDSSQFCGASGGGSARICIPDAQSAQVACLNGHP